MVWLEGIAAALLLVVLPLVSRRQLEGVDPDALPRVQAYRASIVSIGLLGVVGWVLGSHRWGVARLGLSVEASPLIVLSRAGVLLGMGMGLVLAFEWVLHRRGIPRSPWVLALLPRTPTERRWFVVLSMVAGLGEEIAFRGFALLLLLVWTDSWFVAILWTSVAFGWIHGYQGTLSRVRAGLLGVVLAVPVAVGWGLWPSILAHTAIDWIGGLMLGPRLLAASRN